MHLLKIVMQGVGETLMFRFKDEMAARSIREQIQEAMQRTDGIVPLPMDIVDDYGLFVRVPPYGVLLVQQIDFEKAVEGDAIWQYKQKKIQDRVINRMMTESPIIVPPGGPNGRKGI